MSLVAQMAEDLVKADQQRTPQTKTATVSPTKSERSLELPLFAAADKLQKSQKRKRRAVIAVSFVATMAVGAGAYYFVWLPNAQQINVAAAENTMLATQAFEGSAASKDSLKEEGSFELEERLAVASDSAPAINDETESAVSASSITNTAPVKADVADEQLVGNVTAKEAVVKNVVAEVEFTERAKSSAPPSANVEVVKIEPEPPVVSEALETSSEVKQEPNLALALEPALIKTVNTKSDDQQLVELAKEKLRANQAAAALSVLQNKIDPLASQDYASYSESLSLYASLLVDQRQYQRATTLIDTALAQLPVSEPMMVQAIRLNIGQQQYDKAQQRLDSQLALGSANTEELLGLQAALHQQQQDWPKAEAVYRQLLNIDAYKADYWMGLAVAHDAMRSTSAAKAAYQRAITLGDLKPSLQHYAMTRVAQL